MNDIYHVRLNTGEDLISEIEWPETKPGHESHVILHNPMKIIAVPSNKPGFVTLSLMQWVFAKISSSQEFNIYSRDILTMSRPTTYLSQYYKETVVYFKQNNKPASQIEQYLDDLEREIQSVEESDKLVEEGDLSPDIEDIVTEFLNSLTSNNKGTLH